MSNITKIWMEQSNDLLADLSQKIQYSFDRSLKLQLKTEQGASNDWNQYFPINQLALDNQDVFRIKYINGRFILSQFIFQQRYDEQEYQVKLMNSYSETEINQEQYRNAIFEFCMSDNYALLLSNYFHVINSKIIQSKDQTFIFSSLFFFQDCEYLVYHINQFEQIVNQIYY